MKGYAESSLFVRAELLIERVAIFKTSTSLYSNSLADFYRYYCRIGFKEHNDIIKIEQYLEHIKLSAECLFALYDAAVQLERAVAALSCDVKECSDDLSQLCQHVRARDGRLIECLEINDSTVTFHCKEALINVSLK